MPRRKTASRTDLREQALAAAERIVAEQGCHALSTRRIAAAIGYTAGSLYTVFENLDDLIVRINSRTLARLAAELQRAVGGKSAPAEAILGMARVYFRFARRHLYLWRLLFEHLLPEGVPTPAALQVQIDEVLGLVEAELLRLAPWRGRDAAALAARTLWSGVHGVVVLALTGKLGVAGVADTEALLTSLVDNYLRGWLAEGGSG